MKIGSMKVRKSLTNLRSRSLSLDSPDKLDILKGAQTEHSNTLLFASFLQNGLGVTIKFIKERRNGK